MQTIGGREPLHGELGRFYDAIENPRRTRGELPILRDAELRSYLADVRERTLEVLDEVELGPDAEDPLLRDGFVYEMLIAHELQHNETMLQLLQMVDGYEVLRARGVSRRTAPGQLARRFEYPPVRETPRARGRSASTAVATRSAPPPEVSPTTTSGRATRLSWRPSRSTGRRSRTASTFASSRRPGPRRPSTGSAKGTVGSTPRWVATSRSPPICRSSTSPGTRPTPSPAGRASGCRARRSGRRPPRVCDGVGQAWEWTSSDFLAYPGFEAFPYREYSEVFFGDEYKVLRGGSWATHPRRHAPQLPQLGPAPAAPDLRRPALREGCMR